jgi:hypothetical protein
MIEAQNERSAIHTWGLDADTEGDAVQSIYQNTKRRLGEKSAPGLCVLLLDGLSERRERLVREHAAMNRNCIALESEDAALDWLWEHGHEIATAVLDDAALQEADANGLAAVLARDWPGIKVISASD